jgi:hypothetical protein
MKSFYAFAIALTGTLVFGLPANETATDHDASNAKLPPQSLSLTYSCPTGQSSVLGQQMAFVGLTLSSVVCNPDHCETDPDCQGSTNCYDGKCSIKTCANDNDCPPPVDDDPTFSPEPFKCTKSKCTTTLLPESLNDIKQMEKGIFDNVNEVAEIVHPPEKQGIHYFGVGYIVLDANRPVFVFFYRDEERETNNKTGTIEIAVIENPQDSKSFRFDSTMTTFWGDEVDIFRSTENPAEYLSYAHYEGKNYYGMIMSEKVYHDQVSFAEGTYDPHQE